jgi:hypothetical protein
MLEPYSSNGHSSLKFITLFKAAVPAGFTAKEGEPTFETSSHSY